MCFVFGKQNKREEVNNSITTTITTMRFITRLLNTTILSNNKKILGRWGIDYCSEKTNRKIDWSNVDHCGPCGTEKIIAEKLETKKKNK